MQVPRSNYILTAVDLSIQHLDVKSESFNVFALSHKVTGKGKSGKMLTQVSFIHCLEAPAINSYTFSETFQPLTNSAWSTAICTNKTLLFCLMHWYLKS